MFFPVTQKCLPALSYSIFPDSIDESHLARISHELLTRKSQTATTSFFFLNLDHAKTERRNPVDVVLKKVENTKMSKHLDQPTQRLCQRILRFKFFFIVTELFLLEINTTTGPCAFRSSEAPHSLQHVFSDATITYERRERISRLEQF